MLTNNEKLNTKRVTIKDKNKSQILYIVFGNIAYYKYLSKFFYPYGKLFP